MMEAHGLQSWLAKMRNGDILQLRAEYLEAAMSYDKTAFKDGDRLHAVELRAWANEFCEEIERRGRVAVPAGWDSV